MCAYVFFLQKENPKTSAITTNRSGGLNMCASISKAFHGDTRSLKSRGGMHKHKCVNKCGLALCQNTHTHTQKRGKKQIGMDVCTYRDSERFDTRGTGQGRQPTPWKCSRGVGGWGKEPNPSLKTPWQVFLGDCISPQHTVFQGTAVLKCKGNRQGAAEKVPALAGHGPAGSLRLSVTGCGSRWA